jgi:hypothetical protein
MPNDPPTLFDGHLLPDEPTIEDAFWRFHRENPHVYRRLVDLARQWKHSTGGRRLGMKMLWERLRWEEHMRTTDEVVQLNNSYTALYARLLMAREPELRGLFETRRLRVPEPTMRREAA